MTVDSIWLILGKKLNGEASREELEELAQLLRHHPELHYPIQNITDLWQLRKQADQQEAIEALQKHLLRIADQQGEIPSFTNTDPAERRAFFPFKKAIAFAVAAVLLIAGFFYFQPETQKAAPVAGKEEKIPNSNEISTRAGSHSKIILPDGSLVWLNAGSKLVYNKNFDKDVREVQLNGEAYFDVTKNANRPFIIHTNKMDIKVLGTAFNVKSYDDDKSSETSLIHGSIEVTMKDALHRKIILKPSDKLVIINNVAQQSGMKENRHADQAGISIKKINYLPADSTLIETSWIDNRLIFRDKFFADIVVEMERKYGTPFRFQKQEVGELMFSGNFKNESIEQVLKALQLANAFTYKNVRDTIVLTK